MNRPILLRALAAALAIIPAQSALVAKEKTLPGLLIKSGETWIFHLENGQPANPRTATEADKPGKDELKVSLSPDPGAMLTITNNTSQFLNYRAFITPKPGKKGTSTSVCTVMSNGRKAFEVWQNAVPAIRLADFTPAQDEEVICK
jgi:hypothetical protein